MQSAAATAIDEAAAAMSRCRCNKQQQQMQMQCAAAAMDEATAANAMALTVAIAADGTAAQDRCLLHSCSSLTYLPQSGLIEGLRKVPAPLQCTPLHLCSTTL